MSVIKIDEDNFQTFVLNNKKAVLVDFWASWCMPCRAVAPIVEELADDLAGSVVVAKVNVDECESIAQCYKVMSIPTLMVFRDGQPVEQMIGLRSKQQIFEMVKKHI